MSKIENNHTWGVRTAARLRAVHAGFSDLSQEERSGYLSDEIEYALEDAAGIPGENRQSLLATLEAYFPVYGDETAYVTTAVPAAREPASKSESPSKEMPLAAMLEQLCDRANELSPAQIQKLAGVFAEQGQSSPPSALPKPVADKLAFPATPAEVDDCLRSINQLWLEMGVSDADGQVLRLNRLLKMLGILTGGFRDIYRFIWPFWREMATRELNSQVFPEFPNGLEAAVQSFITGGEVNSSTFFSEIEKTKKILASVLFGLRKGAEEYGKLYERKFSTEAIADAVAMEESASDVSRIRELSRKCWDKYSQLTKHQTADAIHDAILRSVAEATFTKLKFSA